MKNYTAYVSGWITVEATNENDAYDKIANQIGMLDDSDIGDVYEDEEDE